MLPRKRLFALLAGSAVVVSASAGCILPPAPNKVPDGTTAPEEEMITAMETLKRYNTDVANYVKCLEFEVGQNRLSRDEQARQHNAAIDGLQSIAAKFNEQVRLFKARSG